MLLTFLGFGVLFSMTVIGVVWYQDSMSHFTDMTAHMRTEHLDKNRFEVSHEVDSAIQTALERVTFETNHQRDNLKIQTDHTYSVLQRRYLELLPQELSRGLLTGDAKQEFLRSLTDTIHEVHLGLTVILNLDGELLFSTAMGASNGPLSAGDDQPRMDAALHERIRMLVLKQDSGLIEFDWNHPDGRPTQGLIHARHFEPANWIVGTIIDLGAVINNQREPILNHLANTKFGINGYLFVLRGDGTMLSHGSDASLIGNDMSQIVDASGRNIVEQLKSAAASPGGGFASYAWFKPGEKTPSEKITYVRYLSDLDWLFAAGFYVDDVEAAIAEERVALDHQMQRSVMIATAVLILISLTFYLLARQLGSRIGGDLKRFSVFFDSAATEHTTLDPGSLRLPEFRHLARLANTMIGHRHETERALIDSREQHQLAKRILDNTSDAVVTFNSDGSIIDVNHAYTRITGFPREHAIDTNVFADTSGRHDQAFYTAMHGELTKKGTWEGEVWARRSDGDIYPIWLALNQVSSSLDSGETFVGIFSDITATKRTEERLQNLAFYDALTGLPNRNLFRERAEMELASSRRSGERFALMYLDLDRFKYVNDTLGHAIGDQLLEQVAKTIGHELRATDTLARIGGDEFTLLLPSLRSNQSAGQIAQLLLDRLSRPFSLSDREIFIGASIGIAIYPDDGTDFESLTMHADAAMYQAKESGRNTYRFYTNEINERNRNFLQLNQDLRHALEEESFKLHFQPIISLADGTLRGGEALVRLRRSNGQLLLPTEFIGHAEETGLITQLGDWILRKTCSQAKGWLDSYGIDFRISVNLSSRQLFDRGFSDHLEVILEQTGLPAACLELEITENVLIDDLEQSVPLLQRIRKLGVSIALDDFGTGYSSLSHLKWLPVDTLKLGKALIRDYRETENAAIISAIIELARILGIEVVAVGIEDQAQATNLADHGCRYGQGFHFSEPVTAELFTEQLAEARGNKIVHLPVSRKSRKR